MARPSNLIWLGLAFGLWSLGYNVSVPYLPLWAAYLGASPTQVGLVGGAAYAVGALLGVVSGPLSDHMSRRMLLLGVWVLACVGVTATAFASHWTVLLFVSGLSLAGASALPALNAMVAESASVGLRARAFALVYAASPVGLLVGAPTGGWLAEHYGLRAPYLAAAAATVIATLCLIPLREAPRSGFQRPSWRTTLRNSASPRSAVLATAAGIAYFVLALPAFYLVPYLRDVLGMSLSLTGVMNGLLAASQIGWSLALAALASGGVRLRMPIVAFLIPRRLLLSLAAVLAANAVFGLAVPAPSVLVLPGGIALTVVLALVLRGGYFTLQALGSAIVGDASDAASLGTGFTIIAFGVGLGTAAATVIGGRLYAISPGLPFVVSGVGAVLGAGVIGLVLVASRPASGPSSRPLSGDSAEYRAQGPARAIEIPG